MSYDTDSGLDTSTWHEGIEQRLKLLAELGLHGAPDAEFDRVAAQISAAFAAVLGPAGEGLYAMVNLFREQQTFVGLHNPPGARAADRTMAPDHGFCPEMLHRTKALILADVCANPRFTSNPVVDNLGIRAYAGAPIIHQPTGQTLGTVCVIGTRPLPRSMRRTGLALIKQHRDAFIDQLGQRTSPPDG